MSLFDPTKDQQNADPTEENNQGSYLERLAQAKGDVWRDPEVLAKGKLEADSYIEQLKARLTELEGKVSNEDYSKKLLERLQESPKTPVVASGNENTTLNPDSIKGLVIETVTEHQKQQARQQNLAQAEAALVAKHGTNAKAVLEKRANELGVSVDFLRSAAEQSTAAFLELVNVEVKTETGSVVPNKVNTASGFNTDGLRDWNYYMELKRKDPKNFFTKAVQDQLFADRKALGDKFNLPRT